MPRRIDNTPEVRAQLLDLFLRHNTDFTAMARELGISRDAFVERLRRIGQRPRIEIETEQ
jgi:transcriptional regulator of acetoin/glycerol metabolism